MRVLFLDAYFEPEQIAFTHLERDLLEGLVNNGHKVEVVCPTPTRGVSSDVVREYKNRKKESIFDGNVNVTRFLAPQEGRNPIVRALRYFWCNMRTYQISKKMNGIDVVFANSTPPTQGWMAGRVAKKLNAPLVYSLQDVFPDSLVTTGLTKEESLLWKIGRRIEKKTYEYCSRIIVITEAMKKNLLNKEVDERKIVVISNWIDLDKVYPIDRKSNSLFDEYGISREKYVVLYAGNIGSAQGVDTILKTAELLLPKEDIQFVIFGGGVEYKSIEEKAKDIPNILVHPMLPQEMISQVYSMGDVALITCKKGIGKSGMPSKTWSIMACNTPIIASFDTDSDLAGVIRDSGAGICVNPSDHQALADAILNAYNKMRQGKNFSVDIRDYALNTASKESCVNKYVDTILCAVSDARMELQVNI